MAAAFYRCGSRKLISLVYTSTRFAHTAYRVDRKLLWKVACGCIGGSALSLYVFNNISSLSSTTGYCVPELHAKSKEKVPKQVSAEDARKSSLQAARESRFLHFSSVEYDDIVYMTPQDFLESVAEDTPRPRTTRRTLTETEVKKSLKKTPKKKDRASFLFRKLHNNGLISYTEYLFLLCVITKPQSGFQIAFNMFDMDGNQKMDRSEFLVMERILLNSELEDIMTRSSESEAAGVRPQKKPVTTACDTTLTVYFFGENGKDVLKFDDFHRFMENLQTEVLQLEFDEFSRGMATITEEQFARILLRYTTLKEHETEDYLERLRRRIPDVKGVSFEDFKEFGQFLNNLDDMALAMKMYTYTDKPISQEEFQRAVKACTGNLLNSHVVNVVFQLFDCDGDGHLSRKEFLSVMKDRLHRGFRSQAVHSGKWQSFKNCVKSEMRNQ